MTHSEIAKALKIDHWKVVKYCQFVKINVPTGEMKEKLSLTQAKISKLTDWYILAYQQKIEDELERKQSHKRYWQNEAEMERQDYDNCILEGDELEIFKGL